MLTCPHAVTVPLLVLTVAASRVVEHEELRKHTIHLLVTRHGLSCANIVEKWINKNDWGRGYMLDPALGNVGAHTSKLTAEEVNAWLKYKSLSVDALVSSNIGRAMETGIRMFPMVSPLYVVPYIREHASGDSNKPAEKTAQIRNLISVLGNSSFKVDYRWIDVFGGDFGTWNQFLQFMRLSFLPELVDKLNKPSGSPIVVGVTTHSKFMRDSDVGTDCHQHWDKKSDDGKPLNNQVLDLTYEFVVSKQPPGLDATPKYMLRRDKQPCNEVAGQRPLENSAFRHTGRICLSDVGDACLKPILQYAKWPDTLIGNTDEHNIVKAARQAIRVKEQLEKANVDVDAITEQQTALGKILNYLGGNINCASDGLGCRPSMYCQRPNIGIGSCSLKDEYRADKLASRLQQAMQSMTKASKELSGLNESIHRQMKKECWTGGHPQPLKLPASDKFEEPLREFINMLGNG